MTDVACTCGSLEFAPIYTVKKLSKILSPTGKDKFVQQAEIRCTKCGKPLAKSMEEKDSEAST